MADIGALIKKYFVQPDDTELPSEPMPATFSGCKVTPLIDGPTYFADLAAQIDTLGHGTAGENSQQFIYIAGWWIHLMGGKVSLPRGSGASVGPSVGMENPFSLDGPGAPRHLADVLKDKARAGVDVRLLGWVSFSVMADYSVLSSTVQKSAVNASQPSSSNMAAVRELRKEPTLANKACLNIIAHSAGAVHTKMVLVGNGTTAIGYTGGLDLVGDRHSPQPHPHGQWHDVQAKVEGPAVQAMYDLYRGMWNEVVLGREIRSFRYENVEIASHTPATPIVSSRTLPATPVGKHHVQSLRTVPRFNYVSHNILPENKPISFAPDGLFEVRSAWFNAVLTAERYIYIEDQGFWSLDLMIWLNRALKTRDDLKVILVVGLNDPSDPAFPPYGRVSLYKGLVHDLNDQQRNRVRTFKRDVFVHTKSTIVDDHWAIIGSANAFQRSLYSDVEHAVGLLDEDDQLVRDYRVKLWSDHFGLMDPAAQQKIADIDKALNVWDSAWGTPGSGVTLPTSVHRVPLPTTPTVLNSSDQSEYDMYADVDSRQPWGGCFP